MIVFVRLIVFLKARTKKRRRCYRNRPTDILKCHTLFRHTSSRPNSLRRLWVCLLKSVLIFLDASSIATCKCSSVTETCWLFAHHSILNCDARRFLQTERVELPQTRVVCRWMCVVLNSDVFQTYKPRLKQTTLLVRNIQVRLLQPLVFSTLEFASVAYDPDFSYAPFSLLLTTSIAAYKIVLKATV